MASTHGIVVLSLIALGTAAWFLVCTPEEDAPPLPETPAAASRTDAPAPTDPANARTRVETPSTELPSEARPEVPVSTAATPETGANVVLSARDHTTHAGLDPFTWRFVANGIDALRGDGKTGHAELRLPPVRGTLLVESPGHRPETIEFTPPAADAPVRRLDLFLASRAPATGVALSLRTADGAPVSKVRIDLWKFEGDEPRPQPGENPRTEPLWKRQFDDVDGLFVLDELAPGAYALRAQAIDEEGWAAPMQPARFAFEFHGHEAVPLDAVLAHGQVLRVLQDGDETTNRQISLVVRDANGEVRSVPFRSLDANGRAATGYDVAKVPGRVESLVALPPQEWQLEAFLGEQALPVSRGGGAIGAASFVVTLPR